MEPLDWSPEFTFSRGEIMKVPLSPGVYELLQSNEYPRYEGSTRILKIGMSIGSLRAELENHLLRHTVANRLARLKTVPGTNVTFRYSICGPDNARAIESTLLRGFEDTHWDLPVLNSQRGYARGGDRHYRMA